MYHKLRKGSIVALNNMKLAGCYPGLANRLFRVDGVFEESQRVDVHLKGLPPDNIFGENDLKMIMDFDGLGPEGQIESMPRWQYLAKCLGKYPGYELRIVKIGNEFITVGVMSKDRETKLELTLTRGPHSGWGELEVLEGLLFGGRVWKLPSELGLLELLAPEAVNPAWC